MKLSKPSEFLLVEYLEVLIDSGVARWIQVQFRRVIGLKVCQKREKM